MKRRKHQQQPSEMLPTLPAPRFCSLILHPLVPYAFHCTHPPQSHPYPLICSSHNRSSFMPSSPGPSHRSPFMPSSHGPSHCSSFMPSSPGPSHCSSFMSSLSPIPSHHSSHMYPAPSLHRPSLSAYSLYSHPHTPFHHTHAPLTAHVFMPRTPCIYALLKLFTHPAFMHTSTTQTHSSLVSCFINPHKICNIVTSQ